MILEQIADNTRRRVARRKRARPMDTLRAEAERLPTDTGFPFERALRRDGLSVIAEVKRASPSKGVIAPLFPYREIAREYEEGGAAAVSVLTEPDYFLGDDRYLTEIAADSCLPVLRKDFVVDDYQIYEAKLLGAAAVLLICSLLPADTLRDYLGKAQALGLSALVEAHTAEEIRMALDMGARVVGVNNRDLHTFDVDAARSLSLRHMVPAEVLFVAESGVRGRADMEALEKGGADAVLIGELLMRSADRPALLRELRGADHDEN